MIRDKIRQCIKFFPIISHCARWILLSILWTQVYPSVYNWYLPGCLVSSVQSRRWTGDNHHTIPLLRCNLCCQCILYQYMCIISVLYVVVSLSIYYCYSTLEVRLYSHIVSQSELCYVLCTGYMTIVTRRLCYVKRVLLDISVTWYRALLDIECYVI